QFLLGRSIGGIFYLLGERTFNISTPGIALVNILGKNFLRPYASFPHPNSLAGFLGVAIIFLSRSDKLGLYFSKRNKLINFAIIIGFVTFILTFSQNAWLSFVLAIFIYRIKNIKKVFLIT